MEKRKHRATGNPKGGKRQGAGRPAGSISPLALGERKAILAMRLRVPKDAAPEVAELADEAFETMVSLMRGSQHRYQGFQLAAARAIREEICGPVPTKLEHGGPNGEPLTIEIRELKPEPNAAEVVAGAREIIYGGKPAEVMPADAQSEEEPNGVD